MSPIPKKPDLEKAKKFDDLAAQQDKMREEATGVLHQVEPPSADQTDNLSHAELGTSPTGLVGKDELLKQTQFNLPVSLNERIAVVAAKFHAGNKSHFARAALEDAVSRLEKLMEKK
jgi:hypothetical protein